MDLAIDDAIVVFRAIVFATGIIFFLFSIEEFVQHLGTAEKPVQSLVGDEIKWVRGERVHHLNVVVRYAVNNVDAFQRYRIILNRDGIKRIEFVPNP